MTHYKIVSEWGACLVRNLQKHKTIKWCWSTERTEAFETIEAAESAIRESKVTYTKIEEV